MLATYSRSRVAARVIALVLLALAPAVLLAGASGAARAAAPRSTPVPSSQDEWLALRVYVRDIADRNAILDTFGSEDRTVTHGYLTVWGTRVDFNDLIAQGRRVEIDYEATRRAGTPVFGHNAETFYNGYYTVEEMQTFLDQAVAARPNLAEKVDLGDSWCKTHPGQCTQPNSYNGYDVWAMHITNRDISGPKPVFWFNAGIHAREIVPPELAMRYISWLLDNYDTLADARWLVDYHDIWVVPMMNPDAHHITENGNTTPRTQRKNADKDDGCSAYPPTSSSQFGTDLNRNFPFMWGCCGGSSNVPCQLTYRGPAPNSEEETQSVVAKVRSLIPDQRGPNINDAAPITATGMFVDMHSQARANLYPWGQDAGPAPNSADLRNLVKHVGAPAMGGNNYPTSQSSTGLYFTDGASDDWEYGELGAPGFTIELASGGSFWPAYSAVTTDWNAHRNPLIYLAKISRSPYLLNRGPDANVVATNPITVTQGQPAQLTATTNYNWTAPVEGGTQEVNTYLQNVAAAEYYVDTPPWAGGTGISMAAADGQYNSPTENVQATVDTTLLTPGRHLLMVLGRGANDYEGHQSWGPPSAVFLDVMPAGGTTTPTVTSTPPVPTPTLGAPCGLLPQSASSSCQSPSTYNYAFTFYVESGCQGSVTGPATLSFNAATSPSGPFTPLQTFTRTVTIPSGPNYVSFTGTLTIDSIPPQYTHYQITFSASNLRPNAYAFTTPAPICGSGTVTVTPTSTRTASASVTATACTINFSDVPPSHTFYPFVRCLACLGIVNGYPDGTFKPDNWVTRGQISKIVSLAAGFTEPVSGQTFEDVVPGSTFYDYVERVGVRGIINGYPCGSPGEPCGPGNRPYFRPNSGATRGQLAKIDCLSSGHKCNGKGTNQYTFADVPVDSTYWRYVEELVISYPGIMSGYPCGGPGEPCDSENRPYFRPNNPLTRGQTSKIVANTFFPGCQPPRK